MRFGMAMIQSIFAIADQERVQASGNHRNGNTSPLFVSNLIDIMAAIFTTPVSAETDQELALSTSKSGIKTG
jgi:hypothetical protein